MNIYNSDNPLVTDEDLVDHTSIGAILHREDSILLFKHIKYGWWTIPIGKVKSSQTIEQALIVEMSEETDIIVTKFQRLGEFTKTYDRGRGIKTKINCIIFDIISYEGEIINAEQDKHQWMVWAPYPTGVEHLRNNLSDATKYCLDNVR